MTEAIIKVHRKNDPPIDFHPPSGVIVHCQDRTTFVVLEGGMASGEPSVAILAVNPDGHGVMVETSLDKFLMAATSMMSLAVHQFGWERPEGYASIVSGDVEEGRFHPHELYPGRPGELCTAKVCDRDHVHAVWRADG